MVAGGATRGGGCGSIEHGAAGEPSVRLHTRKGVVQVGKRRDEPMASAAAAVRRSAASLSWGSRQAAVARCSSTPPRTTMPSICSGAARGGNSASNGRSKTSPMVTMPTAKSAANVALPLQRAKRGRAKRPATKLTTMPITSQVSTCRASPMSLERMKKAVSIATQISCAVGAPKTGPPLRGS